MKHLSNSACENASCKKLRLLLT